MTRIELIVHGHVVVAVHVNVEVNDHVNGLLQAAFSTWELFSHSGTRSLR